MSLYDYPKFDVNIPKFWKKIPKFWNKKSFWGVIGIIFISSLSGFFAGMISGTIFYYEINEYFSGLDFPLPVQEGKEIEYLPQTSQEEKIIAAVKNVSPAVVSIIVTKDIPVFEEYYVNPFELFEFQIPQYRQKGTEKQEIGGGTGFVISEDGMVLTNKHVVLDEEADYTVLTNDGNRYSATVLARDPFQDLAVLKIESNGHIGESGQLISESFSTVELGDSDELRLGQTAVAIGNALGEFRNTISVGVISGLGRKITAAGGGLVETIDNVIQTDAAINQGNSGGPLLNLKGQVVGINTATVLQAQSIGFAIPINTAKRIIDQIKELGKIVYPFLGIRYVLVTPEIQSENDLPVDYGAWIVGSESGPAVVPDSAADKAGLQEGDIILEFASEKITPENTLAELIQKSNAGDKVALKVLREEKEQIIIATLGEYEY